MSGVDWLIVGGLLAVLLFTLIASQRIVKSAADFLSANRSAGRYLLTVSSGIGGIGAISIIAVFEQCYIAGFSPLWWRFITGPIGLLLVITGWVYYRYRETRVLTLAQFFELRYSRNFRVFSGLLGWLSGIVNYGIFPAVSVRFFIYYCGIPETFTIPGIPLVFETFLWLMILVIGLGITFAIFGGQVAVMLTDFVQGIFCNLAFLAIMVFLVMKFSWNDIFTPMQELARENPQASLFNPYNTTGIRDFNIWFFLLGIAGTIYTSGAWQGSSGYNSAAKSAHEAKMAGLLGTWRVMVQNSLFIFIPVCAIAFFTNPQFATGAGEVNALLETISAPQVRTQMTVPLFLKHIMPAGLVGIFAAVMFAAMLSTDDTYMHSWGTIFIQDVILPFRQKPFSPKTHIRLLQGSIVFVGVFAVCFSYFFSQTEAILLFMQITGAIYMGGGGAVLIGGLYSRFGTTAGAWAAMIGGSSVSVGLLLLQQKWQAPVAPFLAETFGWAWLRNHMERCPVNGQVAFVTACAAGLLLYVSVSYLDRWINKRPDFNLERMLHRGIYDTTGEHSGRRNIGILKLLGLTGEFTFRDKVIFFVTLGWTMLGAVIFAAGSIGELFFTIPDLVWLELWKYYVMTMFVIGMLATVWFMIGGGFDVAALFRTMLKAKRNDADDGMVIDGRNAGE